VWEILPNLFLGDRDDAYDREQLRRRGITHIVNCSKELSCKFDGEFVYLWLRMEDPDPTFASRIPQFVAFIDEGRAIGKVLVHCTGGVSRSPAVILAYLCRLEGDLQRAADRLSRIVQTGIDMAFLRQIAQTYGAVMTAAEIEALEFKLLGRSVP
jgi:protein-tyrosine phosphatase